MAYSDGPISTIEDLDPEPPSPGGGRRAWEVALGLLVLLGVLGFAGWQWLGQVRQQSDYQAGSESAASQDWDSALSHYSSASGYLDADSRAKEAATAIAQRDTLYKTALAYQDAGNWLSCLNTIRQVRYIQPTYRDSALIEEEATGQIYRGTLTGSVVLRQDAAPPGLYHFGDGGWALLPNSDPSSRVQGTGTGDWLLYDVPDSRSVVLPTPTPTGSFRGSPQLMGRRLMAVNLSHLSQQAAISIDPYSYDNFLWGSDGVWAISYAEGYLSNRAPIRSLSALQDTTVTYQSYKSPQIATVQLNGSKDKTVIMDLDPNSNRYLIASWSGEDVLGGVISSTATTLYLGNAGSNDRLPLYAISGGSFMGAQFSPDGRHALLSTFTPLDDRTEKQAVILITLDNTSPPRTITQTTTRTTNDLSIFFWLTAAFLYNGRYAGDLVVAERSIDHYTLRLIDPSGADATLAAVDVPSGNPLIWSVFQGVDGAPLLLAREDYFGDDNLNHILNAELRFVPLVPSTPPTITDLIVDWDFYHTSLNSATITGGQLLFSTFLCCTGQPTTSVFSFPVARFGTQRERPKTIYSATIAAGAADHLSDGNESFGPSMFTYLSGDGIRVRLYNGQLDLPLESNVPYIYDSSLHPPGSGRLK